VKNVGYKRIMTTLTDVPDEALVDRLLHIRQHERSLLVELLLYLAELDRRKAVVALGYSSLFSFCTEFLGRTKASAFRRTTAARLVARFPGSCRWSNRGSGQGARCRPSPATSASRSVAEAANSPK
jgi:hypothetical protein